MFQLQLYQLMIMQLLQKLKSGFKRTVNWNRYEPKTTTQNTPNLFFDFLIEPSFLGANRLFFNI